MYPVTDGLSRKKFIFFLTLVQSVDSDFIVDDCDRHRWSVFVGHLGSHDFHGGFGGWWWCRRVVSRSSDWKGTAQQGEFDSIIHCIVPQWMNDLIGELRSYDCFFGTTNSPIVTIGSCLLMLYSLAGVTTSGLSSIGCFTSVFWDGSLVCHIDSVSLGSSVI